MKTKIKTLDHYEGRCGCRGCGCKASKTTTYREHRTGNSLRIMSNSCNNDILGEMRERERERERGTTMYNMYFTT